MSSPPSCLFASAPFPAALPSSEGCPTGNLCQEDLWDGVGVVRQMGRKGGVGGGVQPSPSGFATPLFNDAKYIKFYTLAAS